MGYHLEEVAGNMQWGFKNLPVQAESNDGLNFDMLRPLVYQDKQGNVWRVVRTAQTDGASTPELIHTLGFEPYGQGWPAFILHDGGYRDRLEKLTAGDWLNGTYVKNTLDKDACDNLLREAMEWLGVEPVKADAIFEGVHLGHVAFKNDRMAIRT